MRCGKWRVQRRLLVILAQVGAASAVGAQSSLDDTISDLVQRWSIATYATPARQQDDAYVGIAAGAGRAAATWPGHAEPLVWQAIALAGAAKAEGGLPGLAKARQARDLLLAAEPLAAPSLQGSLYATLGTLYAKVPGWPIGFGDAAKAESYLKRAWSADPTGLDTNYFYGDFLVAQGRPKEARAYLLRAVSAAPRPDRDLADKGRHQEASTLLDGLAGSPSRER